MINPFKEVNWEPGNNDLKKFGVTLMAGFPILALTISLSGRVFTGAWQLEKCVWIALIGAGAGTLFWLAPKLSRPFYLIWYFMACCIGLIISNILFTVFYYTIVTLTAFVLRSFGKLSFRKAPDKSVSSYWKDIEPIVDPKRYYEQF